MYVVQLESYLEFELVVFSDQKYIEIGDEGTLKWITYFLTL
jgi:hypothetical protein